MTELLQQINNVLKEPVSIPADTSEDGIARAFAERFKDRLRYDHTAGKWFQYGGGRWHEERTALAFDWARDVCREHNARQPNQTLLKVRTAAAVERFAQADRRLAVTHEEWNADPWLLCTPGGTVDLRTGTIRPNRPDDLIIKATATTPKEMPTPVWDRFLHDATRGDIEFQRYLRRLLGYFCTGDTREHVVAFIYGLGGNGKSVFANTISAILSEYVVTAAMETFTASKWDRHPTELARLYGARLVTASETEEGRAWAESRIKQLTGGDPIAARYMRRDFFEFNPQFKLLFIGNHKPVLHNVDDAARRRFHILPFVHKPASPDPDLPSKLNAEYPGILNWMIEGCLEWQANGLERPEIVRQATDSYFSDQDLFSQWIEESTERKYETTGEPSARLYASWKRWADGQGEMPGSAKAFSERLSSAGYRAVKRVPGHGDKRGFVGIALKGENDDFVPYRD